MSNGPEKAQDFELCAGDSAVLHFPITGENGEYPDISGAQRVRWKLAKNAKATGADIYISKDSNSTMVCDDGVTRQQIEIVAFETDKWEILVRLKGSDTEFGVSSVPKAGSYYHEAEMIDQSGNIATVAIGKGDIVQTLVRNL